MKRIFGVMLIAVPLLFLGISSAQSGGAGTFDQAFSKIAQELKAAQGGKTGGFRALSKGASAGKVSFKIPLKNGKGRADTDKRCFGITLDCEATITGPGGVYNIQVGTSAGSKYKFVKLAKGKPVSFKLETEGGFSSTTFSINIQSSNPGDGHPVQVALAYNY